MSVAKYRPDGVSAVCSVDSRRQTPRHNAGGMAARTSEHLSLIGYTATAMDIVNAKARGPKLLKNIQTKFLT